MFNNDKKIALTTKIALAMFITCLCQARGDEIPQSMAALGDSITAAAFGSYTRTDAQNPTTLLRLLTIIGRFGFTFSARAVEAREVSWSTGDGPRINSHWTRLSNLAHNKGIKFKSYNSAISGAKAEDLGKQVDSLIKWSKTNLKTKAPDYVTLLIGANDVCNDTEVEDFGAAVEESIDRVLAANNNAKIMIGGIPNIERLREVAIDAPLSNLPGLATCKDMWKKHGFCKKILQENDANVRAKYGQLEQDYLGELKGVADTMNAKYGADKVRFAPEVYSYKFTANDISIDCFHPNVKGQQILSDTTWKKTWWADAN